MKVYVVSSLYVDKPNETCTSNIEAVFDSKEKAIGFQNVLINVVTRSFGDDHQNKNDKDRASVSDKDRMYEVTVSEKHVD